MGKNNIQMVLTTWGLPADSKTVNVLSFASWEMQPFLTSNLWEAMIVLLWWHAYNLLCPNNLWLRFCSKMLIILTQSFIRFINLSLLNDSDDLHVSNIMKPFRCIIQLHTYFACITSLLFIPSTLVSMPSLILLIMSSKLMVSIRCIVNPQRKIPLSIYTLLILTQEVISY